MDNPNTHEILINENYLAYSKIINRIFLSDNFSLVIQCYSINEIIEIIFCYKSDANQLELHQYITSRIHWIKKLYHFAKITVGGEQHSDDWHLERNKRLTASSISTVFGNPETKAYKKLMYEKIDPLNIERFSSDATIWGTMMEPIARDVYSIVYYITVKEFGLIPHAKYDFIGASPDGITESGVLLEIKCPFSRNITNKVPKKYYDQIQHQLEVCDYDICHYAEFIFKSINEDFWWNSFTYDKQSFRGIILVIKYSDYNDNGFIHEEYIYSQIYRCSCPNKNDTIKWINNSKLEISEKYRTKFNDGSRKLIGITTLWWILESFNVKIVERSKEWFEKALPKMQEFINKVNYYKSLPNSLEQFGKDTGYDTFKKSHVPDVCVL